MYNITKTLWYNRKYPHVCIYVKGQRSQSIVGLGLCLNNYLSLICLSQHLTLPCYLMHLFKKLAVCNDSWSQRYCLTQNNFSTWCCLGLGGGPGLVVSVHVLLSVQAVSACSGSQASLGQPQGKSPNPAPQRESWNSQGADLLLFILLLKMQQPDIYISETAFTYHPLFKKKGKAPLKG